MTIVSDMWTVSPGACESCGSCEVIVDEITLGANIPSCWSKRRGNERTSQEPLKMWWPVLCLHKPLVCAVAYYIQSSQHRGLLLSSQEEWPHRWQCLSRTYGNMAHTKILSILSHSCLQMHWSEMLSQLISWAFLGKEWHLFFRDSTAL